MIGDSNITIVDLQAVGGQSQVAMSWLVDDPNAYGLPYLRFKKAELRYALTADMASPVSLGYATTAKVDVPVPRGETRYYQARAIDQSDQAGAWCAAVQGTEISGDVLLEINGYWKHPSGLIHQWGHAVSGGDSHVVVTFPIPFPNAVRGVSTQKDVGTVAQHSPAIAAINAGTGGYVSIEFALPGVGQSFYWSAIGY